MPHASQCGPLLLVYMGLAQAAAAVGGPSPVARAEDFTGNVIAVTDGDTLTLRREGKLAVKVRLFAIDCPEDGQPFGDKAKELTSRLVLGQTVKVKEVGKDQGRRTLAWVYYEPLIHVWGKGGIADRPHRRRAPERCLNEELIKAGLAWWWRPAAPRERRVATLVAEAAKGRGGLWVNPRAVPPWVWRNPRDRTDPFLERRLQEAGWIDDAKGVLGSIPQSRPSSTASHDEAECLARRPILGVLRLLSATPDCSGVGHLRISFEVLQTTGPRLRAAVTSCPLTGRCPVLLERGRPGSLYVGALQPSRQPARTVHCVPLPASDAAVTCAVPAESIDRARQLLQRFKQGK